MISVQGEHGDVHGVLDESGVVHQLVAGESGHGLQEQLGRLAKVPDGNHVQALVHLQPVPAVPVAAVFYQPVEW